MSPLFQRHTPLLPAFPPLLAGMIVELADRLQSQNYDLRKTGKTRRADGSVVISYLEGQVLDQVDLRMNAFDYGKNAVLCLKVDAGVIKLQSLMIRHRSHGGDDRGLISIPQMPTPEQLPVIENIIFSACCCVSRGQVAEEARSSLVSSRSEFAFFLPSYPRLATLNADFAVTGLPSLY